MGALCVDDAAASRLPRGPARPVRIGLGVPDRRDGSLDPHLLARLVPVEREGRLRPRGELAALATPAVGEEDRIRRRRPPSGGRSGPTVRPARPRSRAPWRRGAGRARGRPRHTRSGTCRNRYLAHGAHLIPNQDAVTTVPGTLARWPRCAIMGRGLGVGDLRPLPRRRATARGPGRVDRGGAGARRRSDARGASIRTSDRRRFGDGVQRRDGADRDDLRGAPSRATAPRSRRADRARGSSPGRSTPLPARVRWRAFASRVPGTPEAFTGLAAALDDLPPPSADSLNDAHDFSKRVVRRDRTRAAVSRPALVAAQRLLERRRGGVGATRAARRCAWRGHRVRPGRSGGWEAAALRTGQRQVGRLSKDAMVAQPPGDESSGSGLRGPLVGLATAAVYFAAAEVGLSLAFVAEQVTAVWPPTGIALAAVVLLRGPGTGRGSRSAPSSPT